MRVVWCIFFFYFYSSSRLTILLFFISCRALALFEGISVFVLFACVRGPLHFSAITTGDDPPTTGMPAIAVYFFTRLQWERYGACVSTVQYTHLIKIKAATQPNSHLYVSSINLSLRLIKAFVLRMWCYMCLQLHKSRTVACIHFANLKYASMSAYTCACILHANYCAITFISMRVLGARYAWCIRICCSHSSFYCYNKITFLFVIHDCNAALNK